MAAINVLSTIDSGTAITETETTGADTLPAGTTGTLFVRNNSVSGATINLLGDNVTSPVTCTGVGDVSTSSGYDISVGAGELVPFKLATISNFLTATTQIDVTGGGSDIYAYVIG